MQEKSLETTVTIEFTSETKQHLKAFEQQLKHIHNVAIDLVEPKDPAAPALIAIGIKEGAKEEQAIQNVAQMLYDFLHSDSSAQSQKKIFLVTKEGERVDIEPLPVEEIRKIIISAQEGEPA